MIKMSCTISKESQKDQEIIDSVSDLIKRAIEERFKFSNQKYADINITVKFSEDGKANLVLS